MTRFSFRAIGTSTGASGAVSGVREAADEGSLRADLRRSGLVAIEVKPVRAGIALAGRLRTRRLPASDAAWFFQTMRALLGGAVPLEIAAATMEEVAPSPALKRACAEVVRRLRDGQPMAEAAAAVPGLASAQQLALLRLGHESGRIAHAVAMVDSSITSAQKLRRALLSRLIYPMVLIVTAIVAVWFLATFVLPRFALTLEALGGTLPTPTRLTLATARVLVWLGPLLGLGVVVLWAARERLVTDPMRARLERFMLRLPLIGGLVWNAQAALVCETLGSMIEGGADVLAALGQARDVVRMRVLRDRIDEAQRRVREGADPGQALSACDVVPPLAGAVLQVGVRGGDLAGGLKRAAALCAQRHEQTSERMLIFLEPAVVFLLAAGVGWVVYALVVGILAMNDVTTI